MMMTIVKLTMPRAGAGRYITCRNESRSIDRQFPLNADTERLFGDTPVAYYVAKVDGSNIQLVQPVQGQTW